MAGLKSSQRGVLVLVELAHGRLMLLNLSLIIGVLSPVPIEVARRIPPMATLTAATLEVLLTARGPVI